MFLLVTTFLLVASVAGQDYDYAEVLHKSILFYEAQRAGALPEDNRISWRGDSVLDDGRNESVELSGGWFDAGDHVKFGFPMAFSVTYLAWGMLVFEDGYRAAGEWENALDSIKWPLDYFIAAHTSDTEFWGQVGDGHKDHEQWTRPEDLDMERPAWAISTEEGPGTELVAETAAAMAFSSILFTESDPTYAATLLEHARSLYDFGYDFRGKYSDTITNVRDFYNSFSGYDDELCWGAAVLYYVTGEEDYLTKAKEFTQRWPGDRISWDDKQAECFLMLLHATGDQQYVQPVQFITSRWFPGGGIPYTPKGLAWVDQWGPNRYSANMALFMLIAAEYGLDETQGREFALAQTNYMLGHSGRSFVCGFGDNPPQRPHHRGSSCPDRPAECTWDDYHLDAPNPQELTGALVGGPDQNDNYVDDREDYIANEVAIDYNAGWQGAIAGLITLQERGRL